jgi:RNA polymerase sigma-70 factor (ECF subfamily)
MPPQRKRIFVMSRKEGIPNNEIASQLSISQRTVENHITQAINDLKKVILLQACDKPNPKD